jgi:P4 family phage/plasmid primase-like protien
MSDASLILDPDAAAFDVADPSVPIARASDHERLTLEFLREHGVTGEFLMTEQGFAIEFAAHNQEIRYVAEDRSWIAWNGTHWDRACAETLAESFFDDLIRAMLADAAASGESKRRDLLLERVKLASSAKLRRNALALAQPKLMISREAFDRDAADLLNTPGGIVDLRTGEVTPCDPERFLTRCTAIAYDPDACWPERFGQIVRALAGEDDATELWLWRAIGYTLSGRVFEDAVFYLRGNGSNGKSTLLKALASVLGGYAHKIDIRFLTAGQEHGHATEYAALRGKRLVFASEVEKGQRLAISRLKDLTGGDVQKHRGMHQNADDAPAFAPECKVWLAGNHDLAVHGNDHGTWRRLRKIESDKTFAHSAVRDALAESEGAGILAAAVCAAREWYASGLGAPPARVEKATAAYRESQDLLGKFFRDCLVFEPDTYTSKGRFNEAYRTWLDEEGADLRVGPRELTQRLAEHGVTEGRPPRGKGRERCWRGVRLRNASDNGGAE